MFGHRAVGHGIGEEPSVLFPRHEEGLVVGRIGSDKVAHVILKPLVALPFDENLFRIPRTALHIAGSAVVEHAAVGRPREGPAREEPHAGRIFLRAAGRRLLHRIKLVGFVVVVARVDPHAAGSRTVSLKLSVARQELAVLDRIAVDRPAHSAQVVLAVDLIVHVGFEDRIRIDAAFLLVERTDAVKEYLNDFKVRLGFTRRQHALLTPLHPTAGIRDRADLFVNQRSREEVHLRLDLGGIHVRGLPEGSSFRREPVSTDEPIQIGHRIAGKLGIRR